MMIRERVTYYHYEHQDDATLVVEHWQDAEVVRARELAWRERMLAKLNRSNTETNGAE